MLRYQILLQKEMLYSLVVCQAGPSGISLSRKDRPVFSGQFHNLHHQLTFWWVRNGLA